MKAFRIATLVALMAGAAIGSAQMLPPLSPEMKKLDWFLGSWSGKVNWTMPDMTGETDYAFTNEVVGQFIRSTSKMVVAGMSIEEVGYIGYDPDKKKYSSHTFTNMAPTPRVEWGVADGDSKLVFHSEPWNVMGSATSSRATILRKGADEMSFILEFKTGETWSKVGEGNFKRKK